MLKFLIPAEELTIILPYYHFLAFQFTSSSIKKLIFLLFFMKHIQTCGDAISILFTITLSKIKSFIYQENNNEIVYFPILYAYGIKLSGI
jgi:hypothetical protein